MHTRIALILAVFLTIILHEPANSSESIYFSGNSSIQVWRTHDTNGRIINTSLNRFRLQLDGIKQFSKGNISMLAVYDNEVLAGGLVKSSTFHALEKIPDPTSIDLSASISSGKSYRWTHQLTRAFLGWRTDSLKIVAGRQRVAWGSGRVWNPTDRFNPTSPISFDAGGRIGIDAIFAEKYIGSFGAAQFVAAPSNRDHGVTQKIVTRWRDTIGEADYALLVGSIGNELITGIDIASNFMGGGFYFELTTGRPKNKSSYIQFSTGYATAWSPTFLENYLTIGFEYLRNTAANGKKITLSYDRLQTRREHLMALSLGYDIGFLWRASAVTLLDIQTGSRAIIPSLTWSAAEDIDIEFLGQFYQGGPESEFGYGQDAVFIRIATYF